MTVPRSAASSSEKSVSPGTQPSCEGFVPGLAAGFLPDDHLDAVVAHVQCLGWSLHAVTQHRDHLILQYLACFFQWEFLPGDDFFFNAAKIQSLP